jgi:hypoxanthine phosphoribosyltransferase
MDIRNGYRLEELINENTIKLKVRELAEMISKDFYGKDILLLGVLKGGAVLLCDLAREITSCGVEIAFVSISSYKNGTVSKGEIKLLSEADMPIEGQNVIIVEDIIDTGFTLSFLVEKLKAKAPKNLKICTLLDKPSRRKVNVKVDYIGFEIPDFFVVGYGLDYANRFRNLRGINRLILP